VFNPRGEKIADCGAERDALNLIGMRNRRWEGHYYTFIPLPGDIVDVNSMKTIEADYEHINDDPHDGWWLIPEYPEWREVSGQNLPQSNEKPLDLE